MKHHIISYSGGLASFGTACKIIEEHGAENVTLLFADTLIEDEDLYRFLYESAEKLGAHLVHLKDGRTPWEVFKDVKYIGNSRTAPCSRILKTDQCSKWMKEHYSPETAKLCLGLLIDEWERLPRAQKNWEPWEVTAPLCEEPVWSARDIDNKLKELNIERPRLYDMGFPHNNCGGFCVRAGQRQMQELYEQMPERFLYHEEQMEHVLSERPKTKPFLKKTEDGETRYLSLKDFREMMDENPDKRFGAAHGGCACFVDD